MMDYTNSTGKNALNNEINAILNTRNKYGYTHDIMVHLPDGRVVRPVKLMTVDTVRDYNNNITDEMECSFLVTAGTWADVIFPNINNLEISLTRQSPSTEGTNAMADYGVLPYRRYKAIVKNPIDIRKMYKEASALTTEQLEHHSMLTIEAQLIPNLILELKTIQIGTNCVDTTVGTALKCLLTEESRCIEGMEPQDMLQGVDMVEPDNQNVYENMPIPHGVFLINLPVYMQERMYGVYAAGLNHFIQDNYWYVYPKKKVERSDSQVRYLNIYLTRNDWFVHNNETWRKDGDDVFIIAEMQGQSDDQTQAKMINEGNGLRTPNTDMDNTDEKVKVEGNKAVISRQAGVSEFKTKENPMGVDFAPLQIKSSSANLYEQVSKLEGVDGMLYALVWYNSAPEIIKPGMMVRVHYVNDDKKPMILEGLLMKAHHYLHPSAQGIIKSGHRNTSGLFLFSRQKLDGTTV